MKRHTLLSISALFVAVAALASPSTARADRNWYVGVGGGFYNDFDCCHVHGRIQGDIGWHFGGDDTGFFLEIDPIFTLGPDYWMFTGGVRLGGDIEVHHDAHFRVLLRPSGMFGIGARDFGNGAGAYGILTLQPAFDVRFVLAEGLIALWLRPVSFDILIWWDHGGPAHDWYASAAYQLLGGIDFQF